MEVHHPHHHAGHQKKKWKEEKKVKTMFGRREERMGKEIG